MTIDSASVAQTQVSEAICHDDPILAELPELRKTSLTAAERASIVSQSAYWASLCPMLHVNDPSMSRLAADSVLDPDPDLVDECRDRMAYDGYFDIEAESSSDSGLHLRWVVDIAAMAEGVKVLAEHGWPPGFLLMYDEPWVVAHQLKTLMLMTSGNRLTGDFSVFNVGSGRTPQGNIDSVGGASSMGWAPHRDRGTDASVGAFRPDGMPKYSTTWIPLTDATPTNSCLYVVPRSHDPGYSSGDSGRNPLQVIFATPNAFQHIRALPCKAGSLVHFSHRLLHWGSAAADKEVQQWKSNEGPRIALSFACADDSFERSFIDRKLLPLPPLPARASLIAGLAIAYLQNEDPGQFRGRLYLDIFQSNPAAFDAAFSAMVLGNYEAYFER